jgi:hypothetical protein
LGVRNPDFAALAAADERLGAKARHLLVAPFYLKLMGRGAIRVDERTLKVVGRRSRKVTADEVRLMLQGTWRPLVMGAWYAIALEDDTFTGPVHDALETCLGHLTSPALITATLFYPSERTPSLLADYAVTDRERSWGAAKLADAAGRHLTGAELPREDAGAKEATAQLGELVVRGVQLRQFHGRRRVD